MPDSALWRAAGSPFVRIMLVRPAQAACVHGACLVLKLDHVISILVPLDHAADVVECESPAEQGALAPGQHEYRLSSRGSLQHTDLPNWFAIG